jgi:hypothetical protein
MKALSSVIVLGIGLLMVSGSPARAQMGGMGDAMKKGAADAAKQEMMKNVAEKAGLPTPGAASVTPAADTGVASTPVDQPKGTPGAADTPAAAPGSDAGAPSAPVGEPKIAPAAADVPAGATGAAGAAQDAAGALEKKMPKLP